MFFFLIARFIRENVFSKLQFHKLGFLLNYECFYPTPFTRQISDMTNLDQHKKISFSTSRFTFSSVKFIFGGPVYESSMFWKLDCNNDDEDTK